MIHWCSYCQAFLREAPPFEDPTISHGMCEPCFEQIESGEQLVDRTAEARSLMRRIFDCGSRAEMTAIPSLVVQASRHGLSRESILMGMLQPALYRVGQAWRRGTMSVTEEHRFTMWCDAFLAHLTTTTTIAASSEPLDMLILVAPGNEHTLGPRFAAELLAARGVSSRVVVPGLPTSEVVAEIERLRPLVVGFSCALPSALPESDAFIADVRAQVDRHWNGAFMLSGLALRGTGAPWTSAAGAVVTTTLEDVARLVERERAKRPRPAPGV